MIVWISSSEFCQHILRQSPQKVMWKLCKSHLWRNKLLPFHFRMEWWADTLIAPNLISALSLSHTHWALICSSGSSSKNKRMFCKDGSQDKNEDGSWSFGWLVVWLAGWIVRRSVGTGTIHHPYDKQSKAIVLSSSRVLLNWICPPAPRPPFIYMPLRRSFFSYLSWAEQSRSRDPNPGCSRAGLLGSRVPKWMNEWMSTHVGVDAMRPWLCRVVPAWIRIPRHWGKIFPSILDWKHIYISIANVKLVVNSKFYPPYISLDSV